MNSRLANWEIVVLALHQAGGALTPVQTEDVAVRAWKLAPQRFSWRNYPEYPDLDTARVALTDAQKEKNGRLVQGDKRGGWSLTPAGLTWVQQEGASAALGSSHPPSLRVELTRDLERLREHPLRAAVRRRNPEPYEIADAVGLVADAPTRAVEARIDQLENASELVQDAELTEVLRWLRQSLRAGH